MHAENGSWLFLTTGAQSKKPYASTPIVPHLGAIPQQSVTSNIAKQISVPHGNSILAQGGIKGYTNSELEIIQPFIMKGPVTIENFTDVIPDGINKKPYETLSIGNSFPNLNNNPNLPLQNGVKDNKCNQYIQWGVNTKNPDAEGAVTNIPFEKEKANVISYEANYWLQNFKNSEDFTQLSYNQTIWMDINIKGKLVSFPHFTCNTLTKKV